MSGVAPTDINGNPLAVGDTVIFAAMTRRRAYLRTATVIDTRGGQVRTERLDVTGRKTRWWKVAVEVMRWRSGSPLTKSLRSPR